MSIPYYHFLISPSGIDEILRVWHNKLVHLSGIESFDIDMDQDEQPTSYLGITFDWYCKQHPLPENEVSNN